MNKKTLGIAMSAAVAVTMVAPAAYAATTASSQLSQTITNGVLSTSVRDASNAVVATPSFSMGSVALSTSQQTATGTFGSNTQRISVDNPGGANDGWTLSLNATTPGTGTWVSGANSYAYNGTAAAGQLTLNPLAGTLTSTTGTNTGITLGASAAFTGTSPVTIATAAAASDDVWNGYITGIGVSQTIPAAQAAGTYVLDMTQTIVAN